MPKITNISFGSISINGRKYETDVVVFWDGEIIEREKSRNFSKRELLEILLKEPDSVIVGTGMVGNMKVEQPAIDYARINGINLIVKTTKEAVKDFNDLIKTKNIAAVFHVSD